MHRIAPDKPLGGRYKIISQLGVGGFGRTFLAEDLHLPGHPRCVIKHLKPQSKNDDTLQMARRCFNIEAQVLYHLGIHDQIPRLLAHFEEDQEFYLAQEFIEGEPLTRELVEGKLWPQGRVVALIKDVLQVLSFVHQEQVIHRDLKPSNLIRRQRDRKVVLIDFGAVKQVSTPNFDPETGLSNITISIGTQGYMPNEQLAGKPKFCSDIYAVGVLAIQALTGVHPRHFGEDAYGEIAWQERANHISPELLAVINRMVRYDFRERYIDAAEALVALEDLPSAIAEDQTNHNHTLGGTSLPGALKLELGANDTAIHAGDTASQTGTASQNSTTITPNSATVSQNHTVTGFSSPFAKTNIEYSRGNDLVAGSEEEPMQTAIWMPTESLVSPGQTTQNNGTGLTQAVGRPHIAEAVTASPPQTASSPRFARSWAVVGILLGGLAVGLLTAQIMVPDWSKRLLGRETVNATDASEPNMPTDPEKHAAALLTKAANLMQRQQYDQSLKAYEQAIALKPNNAEAYAGRCEALNQLHRPEEAIVSCNDALAYRPNYAEALWSQGNARLLQNRPYEALKLYEEVTERKPDFAPGWLKRGVALQKLGRSAEALVALDQAIKLERNLPEAWITQGEALLNLQRYDAALAAIDKALQLQPNDATALKLRQEVKSKAE
jgi:serine/threonine protein kinase/Flp pilus assembly protein TadD